MRMPPIAVPAMMRQKYNVEKWKSYDSDTTVSLVTVTVSTTETLLYTVTLFVIVPNQNEQLVSPG